MSDNDSLLTGRKVTPPFTEPPETQATVVPSTNTSGSRAQSRLRRPVLPRLLIGTTTTDDKDKRVSEPLLDEGRNRLPIDTHIEGEQTQPHLPEPGKKYTGRQSSTSSSSHFPSSYLLNERTGAYNNNQERMNSSGVTTPDVYDTPELNDGIAEYSDSGSPELNKSLEKYCVSETPLLDRGTEKYRNSWSPELNEGGGDYRGLHCHPSIYHHPSSTTNTVTMSTLTTATETLQSTRRPITYTPDALALSSTRPASSLPYNHAQYSSSMLNPEKQGAISRSASSDLDPYVVQALLRTLDNPDYSIPNNHLYTSTQVQHGPIEKESSTDRLKNKKEMTHNGSVGPTNVTKRVKADVHGPSNLNHKINTPVDPSTQRTLLNDYRRHDKDKADYPLEVHEAYLASTMPMNSTPIPTINISDTTDTDRLRPYSHPDNGDYTAANPLEHLSDSRKTSHASVPKTQSVFSTQNSHIGPEHSHLHESDSNSNKRQRSSSPHYPSKSHLLSSSNKITNIPTDLHSRINLNSTLPVDHNMDIPEQICPSEAKPMESLGHSRLTNPKAEDLTSLPHSHKPSDTSSLPSSNSSINEEIVKQTSAALRSEPGESSERNKFRRLVLPPGMPPFPGSGAPFPQPPGASSFPSTVPKPHSDIRMKPSEPFSHHPRSPSITPEIPSGAQPPSAFPSEIPRAPLFPSENPFGSQPSRPSPFSSENPMGAQPPRPSPFSSDNPNGSQPPRPSPFSTENPMGSQPTRPSPFSSENPMSLPSRPSPFHSENPMGSLPARPPTFPSETPFGSQPPRSSGFPSEIPRRPLFPSESPIDSHYSRPSPFPSRISGPSFPSTQPTTPLHTPGGSLPSHPSSSGHSFPRFPQLVPSDTAGHSTYPGSGSPALPTGPTSDGTFPALPRLGEITKPVIFAGQVPPEDILFRPIPDEPKTSVASEENGIPVPADGTGRSLAPHTEEHQASLFDLDMGNAESTQLYKARTKLGQRPRWANGVVGNVLNGTLFSTTVTQLSVIIKHYDQSGNLGVPLLVLIAISMVIQVVTGCFLVYLTVNNSTYSHPKRIRSLTKCTALLAFILFLINIAIDGFYVQLV